MGRPSLRKFVNRLDIAATAIGASQPSPSVVQVGFPVGNVLYKKLSLSFRGAMALTASGAGSITTRGGLQFLRSLSLETDKHGRIVDGLDGILLGDMQTIRKGTRPPNTDISNASSGTPTFAYALEIPFFDPASARPEDLGLDMYGARPTLTTQVGVAGDFISGGTYTVQNVTSFPQEIHAEVDPGPVDPADGPLLMPYWGVRKEPITSTATQYQIILPYGDRVYKRIYITQRDGVTLESLSNTVVGANASDRLSLKVNGYSWVDSVQWLALQDQNSQDYGLTAMPTGVAVLDFVQARARGHMLSNALSVVNNVAGTIELDIDVTTASGDQLWIGMECAKPIPPAALRPQAQGNGA